MPRALTGRSAAVVADAAINALSSNEIENDTSRADASFQGRNKRAKVKPSSVVAVSQSSILIEQPAPIDRLPYEIRRQIISYIEDDTYTILNLMLVSRVWYVTLRNGDQAELDFQRRCHNMGAKRKSSGRPTWHATWIDLLHKKCAYCYATTKFNIGNHLLYGFKYLMICESCFHARGPLEAINIDQFREMTSTMPYLNLAQLPIFLPDFHPSRRPPSDPWEMLYRSSQEEPHVLKAAIAQKLCQRAQEFVKIEKFIDDYTSDPETRRLLRGACIHSRNKVEPRCSLLDKLVQDVLEDNGSEKKSFVKIEEVYGRIQNIPSLLEDMVHEHNIDRLAMWPRLKDTCASTDIPSSVSWLEAIAGGDVQLDQYFKAVLEHKEMLAKAAEEHRQRELESLQREKSRNEEVQMSGDWAQNPLCMATACPYLAENYCSQVCCIRCCAGPCILHGKTVNLAYLQSKGADQISGTPTARNGDSIEVKSN